MQSKLITDSGAQKTTNYVSALVKRSGAYYSAWLKSSGSEETVQLSSKLKAGCRGQEKSSKASA